MPITRGSWYSQLPPFGWFDRGDRPGSNALGVPDWQQGIATPGRSDLGKWFNVTPPGEKIPYPMQKTDIGPAKWTGRGVDISAAGAHQMGYTPQNFPTDANFKVEPRDEPRGLGSPAGMPVQAGDMPDNAVETAYAPGPGTARNEPQGPRMPDSLMDMFQPTDPMGKPTGWNDAIAQRSNSLIGLGLGLLQPIQPGSGQTGITQGLRGLMQGSQLDTQQADRRAQLARQAAQDKLAQSNWERSFTQNALTPYQKMEADIARAKGTPNEQQVADFYRSQLDAGPPQTREVFDPTLGRNVVQEWDSRSRQYKTATMGGGGTTASAPADPFTTPGAGRPVYGEGGNYSTPAPAAAATQAQPVLPPKKPLTAHEQTAIDDADKAVLANRAVLGSLQDAKRLSKNAFSGLFPMQRAQIGAQIPDYAPGMSSNQMAKDTLLLNNTVIGQAVEQLKATFGGNPSEGERKILLDLAGSVNSPDDVRQKIFEKAEKAAHDRLELNERRAREIRSGTYYNPGGGVPPAAPTATVGGDPLADARDAIKRGAPRAAVIERLAKSGVRFNPKDLD